MKYELQRPLSLRLQRPRIPVTVFNCPRIQVFLRPRIQAFPKQHPTQIHLLPLSQASSALPLLFEKASLEWCRGNSKVGEPSEREALLTILLDIPARECLVVISLWGAK
jgi:hypothetical protein